MDDDTVPRAYRRLHRFVWHFNNHILPAGEVEAIFSFRSPFLTQWKATLDRSEVGMRTADNLPVVFSLQYFPVPEDDGNGIRANLSVNISNLDDEWVEAPRLMEPYSFVPENRHTYRFVSSIRPNDLNIEIVVYLSIGNRGGYRGGDQVEINDEVSEMELDSLAHDLREVFRRRFYFDMTVQSVVLSRYDRVHSFILDVRWPDLVEKLGIRPNENNPPTAVADISPAVLLDILFYIYTGDIDQFKWFSPNNRRDDNYKTLLFQAMDAYPLHHLHMILQPESRVHKRITRFFIFQHTAVFEIEPRDISPTYTWQHIPYQNHSVMMSLTILVPQDGAPSFSYWLKFKNPVEIHVRVNLICVRQVGLGRETETLAYEQSWELPENGEVGPTLEIPIPGDIEDFHEFVAGGDRVERGHRVRHALRLNLDVSAGIDSIKMIRADNLQYSEETQTHKSKKVFHHHMSVIQNRAQYTGTLHVSVVDPVTGNPTETHRLHKAIFEYRVPNWRNVVQEVVPAVGRLPDNVTCATMNGVFQIVTNYLYTGRYRDTPTDLIDAVRVFAEQSGFNALRNRMLELFHERFVEREGRAIGEIPM